MHLLALSGSLRSRSKNSTMLRAMALLAPAGVTLQLAPSVGELPHFNPELDDLDRGQAPAPVLALRRLLREADGVMICSPEYAHGVAGAMKNALDWLVGSGELVDKPVVVMNLSPTSFHAQAALVETLRVMSAVVMETRVEVPISGQEVTEAQALENPATAALLRASLAAVMAAVEQQRLAQGA
ncbi:MAG: NAD(P)H-dependent oxidoreductase [Myxococcales bacterium]|jgi:NAD(P)H-dependent FMN reductase|nr:NAD(P)H-dependent oxidoreductase [Myxococcales bacterium]